MFYEFQLFKRINILIFNKKPNAYTHLKHEIYKKLYYNIDWFNF